MADESRPEDETPPKPKRRRRPQTLELKATEVGKDKKPSGGHRDEPRQEAPKQEHAGADSAWAKLQSQADNWRGLLPMPVLTGALGVLAGALLVYLLLPRSPDADPRVGALTEEVATLSGKIESLAERPLPAPAPDQSGLAERIDKLTAAIGETEARLAAIEQRPQMAPDLSAVNERTAAIDDALGELRGGVGELKRLAERTPEAAAQAVEKLGGRIAELEQRIAAFAAASAAAPPANLDAAAEVLALNALSDAVRSGKPFEKELAATRALLGERTAKLAPLEPHAASGVPTAAMLEQQFAELAPRLLLRPEPDGNFFERLMNNASRLVEIRPAGEAMGSGVGAIVARAEAKLARDDLAGAIAEVESLPEAEQSRAADWLVRAKARRDAAMLVRDLAEASLAEAREAAKP